MNPLDSRIRHCRGISERRRQGTASAVPTRDGRRSGLRRANKKLQNDQKLPSRAWLGMTMSDGAVEEQKEAALRDDA
jgi:hypothetical protein